MARRGKCTRRDPRCRIRLCAPRLAEFFRTVTAGAVSFFSFFLCPIMRAFCGLVLKWNTPQQVVTANTEIPLSARSAVPCTRWHFEHFFLSSYLAGCQMATVDRSVRTAGTEICTLCPEVPDFGSVVKFLNSTPRAKSWYVGSTR